MIINVNYDNMRIPKIYKPILQYHNCTEGVNLIKNLELYDIKSREDIVYILNDLSPGADDYVYMVSDTIKTTDNAREEQKSKYGSILSKIAPITRIVDGSFNKTAQITEVEEIYDVLVEYINGKLYIYHSIENEINKQAIIISLAQYEIKFIAVTPMNYLELKGKPLPKYDLLFLFRRLIVACMEANSSDLKIMVVHKNLKPYVKYYFRVDNSLVEYNKFEISVKEEMTMLKQVVDQLSSEQVSTVESTAKELSLNNVLCTDALECRLAITPTLAGYFANFRLKDAEEELYSLEKLGLDEETYNVLKFVSNKKYGGTFITGPMRMGKSTTMWGLMSEIIKKPVCCVEYSNPIESKSIIPQVPYSGNLAQLQQLLSVAKKQDINVIFLNEIPNSDIALKVRELINANVHVISTLHMSRIWHFPQTFNTFYGNEYKDFITQMNLIVNQRLVVKQCPHCKYTVDVEQLEPVIRKYLLAHGIKQVSENLGCEHCNNGELLNGKKVYTEYFLFTTEMITRLRTANSAGDMEQMVKDIVLKDDEYVRKKVAIDYKILEDIKAGTVSYRALYDLI